MKNTCIVCGKEFESERTAQFCVDRPGCRQAHNRQERRLKRQGENIGKAIAELVEATKDPNHQRLAKETLLKAEKQITSALDQLYPNRHPKKEIAARPIRIDPMTATGKVYVIPPMPGEAVAIEFGDNHVIGSGWIEAYKADGKRWNRDTVVFPQDSVLVRIVEPETDQEGREIVERYNEGWGAVVNPNRQTEIAPIPAYDDYSED